MRKDEAVAIIGIGCRFPTANGPEAFWELLRSGRDAVRGGYDDRRLDIAGGLDEEWVRRLKSLSAGTLDDIDVFDAPAFNISAREARLMDPQQRLMLETAWEALDDAGQDARRLTGRRVGVFTAIYGTDYQHRLFRHFPDVDVSLTTGASSYALSGRVSYAFGFEGPSTTIETACSSSLVAVHDACRAVASGDCELALAGGVNLLLDPIITLAYLNAGALSPGGRCRFGDAAGDGYVRSEGVGVIVLKPLARALRDGDPIYAVVRASVTSHVGQTGSSLFEPSEPSQITMFREALARAGRTPAELDFIEAHGTGTRVGDRIELNAVSMLMRGDADRRTRPCLVGSAKTVIGHTESAAGIAGVIKAALCLRHGQVPGNLHFDTPHPDVPWDDRLFRIPTTPTAIGEDGRPATATVSSFGITGTIACVVLESPPPMEPRRPAAPTDRAPFVLPLSARSPEALGRYAQAIAARIAEDDASGIADLVHSAALRRTHHDVRLVAIGATGEDLMAALAGFRDGEPAPGLCVSELPVIAPPKVAWAFCGQGSQWTGMGLDLYAAEPTFRAKMDELDAAIQAEAGVSVLAEIRAEGTASRLDRTDITQPAMFAIQAALAELLASWGLSPAMVVGHSVGEVAAAYVTGVLSRGDAVRVICARGRITEKAAGWGKMAAVEQTLAEAEAIVAGRDGALNVAAINGPRSITLAGLREPLEQACRELAEQGRFARMIDVDYPSHCVLLDPLRPEMSAACAGVTANAPAVPLYSTVLGRRAELADLEPGYWTRNMRETVRFAACVEAMAEAGADLFVEISPHPALAFSIKQTLAALGSAAGVIGTMRSDGDGPELLRVALGEHYVRGAEPNWRAIVPAGAAPAPLPRYSWDHERYWIEEPQAPSGGGRIAARVGTPGAHPLLERRIDLLGGGGAVYWMTDLSLAGMPWIGDHRVRGRATFPAAGYLAAMIAAADEIAPGTILADLDLREALTVPESGAVRLQLGFVPEDGALGGYRVTADGAPSDQPAGARTHVTARLAPATEPLAVRLAVPRGGGAAIDGAAVYAAMARGQLDYRGRFHAIASLAIDGSTAIATLDPAPSAGAPPGLHPATIDACLQALLALAPGWRVGDGLWLPRSIARVRCRPGAKADGVMTARAAGIPSLVGDDFMGDVVLADAAGEVQLSLEGVRLHKVARARADTSMLHEVRWPVQAGVPPLAGPLPIDAGDLVAAASAGARTVGERATIDAMMREADRLGGLIVQHALGTLGREMEPGRRFTLDELAREGGVVPEHRRLLRRLVAMLARDGVVATDGDGWRVVAPVATDDPAVELDAAIGAAEPDFQPFWRMFARAGGDLAAVLAGRKQATEVLFGGEGAALLEQLYADHPPWRAPIRQLALAIDSLVEQLPADRTLRVLEIGAGTGGVTGHLLPLLPADRADYVFTDLSRYFLDRARERFAAYPFVTTQLLDIESDPTGQGFEPMSFDAVVAANCLHATLDLRQSLEHAARLLKPGGLLLLQEETRGERGTDLIFGLTEGWWRFADGDLRPDHALLAPDGWTRLLDACGFDGATILGGGAGDPNGAVAIVAQRRAETVTTAAPWLLLADDGDVAERLARRLAEAGQPCRAAPADTAMTAVRDYLAARDEPGQAIVDLRPLDARLADDDDVAALTRIETQALDGTLGVLGALIDGARRHPPRFVLVTARSQATGDDQGSVAIAQAALWTVARNAALENPGLPIAAIDLGADDPDPRAIDDLAAELAAPAGEPEVALRRGRRRARRLFRWDEADPDERRLPDGAFALEVTRRGVLDGFEAVAVPPEPPAAGEVRIGVRAAGVNFHDLMNLLGAVHDSPLGFECAGEVSAVGSGVDGLAIGDAVIAAGLGTWRSHVTVPASLVAKAPAGVRAAMAAGLPIVYLTAHYALRHLAQVRASQRVLVHAAAGGFGLASLHIARAEGAEVIVTAGTDAKRDYLRGVGAIAAYHSRSLDFADAMRADGWSPDGKGAVDIVVNSLAGEFIPASLDLLADGGVFIEVGKQGIWTPEQVRERRPDVTYHVVDLERIMRRSPGDLAGMLPRIAAEVAAGTLPVLPARAFPMSRAVEALRFMQEARQTGKIVLVPPVIDEPKPNEPGRNAGATLITGGLGGLGLEVARWLADRGERRLILAGRGAPGDTAAAVIDELRARGVEVWTERCDMGEHAQVAALIARCGDELPALASVFHLAGVLADAPLHQLDIERFLAVYRPKVFGAWSLHRLTRDMPIERFVLFSSWTAVLGSPAQANHASANAFLDALAHHRRAQGLPAQSINWGGWGETGAAADPARLAHLARQGIAAMSNADALDAMARVLASDAIEVAVSPFDPAVWRGSVGGYAGAAVVGDMTGAAAEAPAAPIATAAPSGSEAGAAAAAAATPASEQDLREALAAAEAGAERRGVMERRIVRRLSQVLRTPAKALDVRKSFKSLGLDSLTALELRNALELETGLKLPASLIFNHASVAKLAIELGERMGMALDPVKASGPSPQSGGDDEIAALLEALRAMPEDEALRLLSSEGAHGGV